MNTLRRKMTITRQILHQLQPHGHLLTGHAESLANLDLPIRALQPAVYVPA